MHLIHKGFDALDVAFPSHLPEKLIAKLDRAKTIATNDGQPKAIQINGVRLSVAPTGAKGGYAYRCDTGRFGEVWFFKKPSGRDPWGTRVSVSSAQLALRGLKRVREHLESVLETLGIGFQRGTESIARVDFALDFLFPTFELISDYFVMSSRFGKMRHADLITYKEAGNSSRTTSVTVGKNPGRQIIIYDKRLEVITKRKLHWIEIWNGLRKQNKLPPINLKKPEESRIWRVELRAYKRHLKEDWGVSTWYELQQKLPYIYRALLRDVRYTAPSEDTNRSRWPDHPLWNRVKIETDRLFDELEPLVSEEYLHRIYRHQQIDTHLYQMAGSQIALAAIRGIDDAHLEHFVYRTAKNITDILRANPEKTYAKLEKARERYGS